MDTWGYTQLELAFCLCLLASLVSGLGVWSLDTSHHPGAEVTSQGQVKQTPGPSYATLDREEATGPALRGL